VASNPFKLFLTFHFVLSRVAFTSEKNLMMLQQFKEQIQVLKEEAKLKEKKKKKSIFDLLETHL
jgi:hypothetical protein